MSCLICTSSRLRSTWRFMRWSCLCHLMNLSPVCSPAVLKKSRSSLWSCEAAGSVTRHNYKVNRSKRDVRWLVSTLKPSCCVHGRPDRQPCCLHVYETFRKNSFILHQCLCDIIRAAVGPSDVVLLGSLSGGNPPADNNFLLTETSVL